MIELKQGAPLMYVAQDSDNSEFSNQETVGQVESYVEADVPDNKMKKDQEQTPNNRETFRANRRTRRF